MHVQRIKTQDNTTYIGQTGISFKDRFEEHKWNYEGIYTLWKSIRNVSTSQILHLENKGRKLNILEHVDD